MHSEQLKQVQATVIAGATSSILLWTYLIFMGATAVAATNQRKLTGVAELGLVDDAVTNVITLQQEGGSLHRCIKGADH